MPLSQCGGTGAGDCWKKLARRNEIRRTPHAEKESELAGKDAIPVLKRGHTGARGTWIAKDKEGEKGGKTLTKL